MWMGSAKATPSIMKSRRKAKESKEKGAEEGREVKGGERDKKEKGGRAEVPTEKHLCWCPFLHIHLESFSSSYAGC